MSIRISSTEAARNLGDCLARIKHTGETFVLTKNQKPVALLAPLPAPRTAPLKKVLEALRALPSDPGFADDLERVNAADRPLDNPWD
jgi:antitoxin (DNA-binding transcriptional repressor) of toxin-antitoxin stability system